MRGHRIYLAKAREERSYRKFKRTNIKRRRKEITESQKKSMTFVKTQTASKD